MLSQTVSSQSRQSGEAGYLPNRAPLHWSKTPRARQVFKACRWVHVYLSSAMLALLVFFCFTGILLNHTDWFEGRGAYVEEELPIPEHLTQLYETKEDPPIASAQAYIASTWDLHHPRKVDLDLEIGEMVFDYPLPAGYALVTLMMRDGTMLFERQEGTTLAILNDLHKGRHSGPYWSLLIDGSALLIILVSLTGMVILLQQTKWRLSGLMVALAGLLAPWLLYLIGVPQ